MPAIFILRKENVMSELTEVFFYETAAARNDFHFFLLFTALKLVLLSFKIEIII